MQVLGIGEAERLRLFDYRSPPRNLIRTRLSPPSISFQSHSLPPAERSNFISTCHDAVIQAVISVR